MTFWKTLLTYTSIGLLGLGIGCNKEPVKKVYPEVEISDLVSLTDSTAQNILKSNKYVIVKVSTETCPPCKAYKPFFSELASEFTADSVKFVNLELESLKGSGFYGVPQTLYFNKGKQVKSQLGYTLKLKKSIRKQVINLIKNKYN